MRAKGTIANSAQPMIGPMKSRTTNRARSIVSNRPRSRIAMRVRSSCIQAASCQWLVASSRLVFWFFAYWNSNFVGKAKHDEINGQQSARQQGDKNLHRVGYGGGR